MWPTGVRNAKLPLREPVALGRPREPVDTVRTRPASGRALAAIRLLLLAAGVLVLVMACTGPGAQAAGRSQQQQALDKSVAYSKCMRSHGVPNYPDPTISRDGSVSLGIGPNTGINPNSPQFQTAQQDCRKLRPGPGSMTPQELAQFKQGELKIAECMRAHGITNFPDPNSQGWIVLTGTGINTDSPQVQSALKACRKNGHGLMMENGAPPGGASS